MAKKGHRIAKETKGKIINKLKHDGLNVMDVYVPFEYSSKDSLM